MASMEDKPVSPLGGFPCSGIIDPTLAQPTLAAAEMPPELVAGSLSQYLKAWALRVRSGDAGVLPVVVALALVMVVFSVLMFPALSARIHLDTVLGARQRMTLDMALFFAATVSVTLFYLASQREGYTRWRDRIVLLPMVLSLGIGICINQSKAVLEGLFGGVGELKRTPKSGVARPGESFAGQVYKSLPKAVVIGELALGAYFTVLAAKLVLAGVWGPLPFVLLFQFGFLYVGLMSLLPERFAATPAEG